MKNMGAEDLTQNWAPIGTYEAYPDGREEVIHWIEKRNKKR